MSRLAELLRQLAYRLRGERNDADMDEEMRLHLELRAEQARAQGLDPDAAAAAARRRFGNPTLLREQSQDAWGWSAVDGWLRDLREAFRTLRNSPGFTAVAVISLALGIGANAAIFSLVNALLLRTLPVEDPRELVQIRIGESEPFSNPLWEEIRDRADGFDGLLAFSSWQFDMAESGEADIAHGMWVSGDFFRVLGVAPLLGRLLQTDDDLRGGGSQGPVAVISYRLWERRYGKDQNILGRTILLDRVPFAIVGVTPPWFKGLENDGSYDVAIPVAAEPLLRKDSSMLDLRSTWWLRVMARLPEGGTIEQAGARLKAISPGVFRATLPANWDDEGKQGYLLRELTAKPAATGFSIAGRIYSKALFALLGISALVLLVACANIANLLLARGAQRERELSMRMALGAGRARLVRRLLCESLLMAGTGAAAGLALAGLASRLLAGAIRLRGEPILVDLAPDLRVLAFTAGVALLTALLFGLVPSLRATRIQLNDVLKEGARGASQSGRSLWLGKALIAGQLALSLTLLAGAGLFARTLHELMNEDLGFDPSNVLAVDVDLGAAGVPLEQRSDLFRRALERLRAIPNVEAAAQAMRTPISGMTWNNTVTLPGDDERHMLFFNSVSDGYFQTLRSELRMGRDFSATDTAGSIKVIILNEGTARKLWPNENAVGMTLELKDNGRQPSQLFEVVGVVQDAKYQRVTEESVDAGFFPTSQDERPGGRLGFVMRYRGEPGAMRAAAAEAIEDVHPLASLRFRDLYDQVAESTMQQRLVAALSTAFAGLAVLLAVIGLYGVTAYAAARRRGEIGIRIALGAQPGSVVWLMLRDLAVALAVGTALGWAASLGLGGSIESLLYGVEPGDPALLALAALAL
ncbi:MAG: ABC transporter permease, partial [Acidobacteria bacterium]|nr:ABC transporter permease [Acidobacteriota bacterium]